MVYSIPIVSELIFTDVSDVTYNNMTNEQKNAFTVISNNGILVAEGLLDVVINRTGKLWYAATDTVWYTFFKTVEGGIERANGIFYSAANCYRYIARNDTNTGTYYVNKVSLNAGDYNIVSSSRTSSNAVLSAGFTPYDTLAEAEAAIDPYRRLKYPIIYRLVNSSINSAPDGAQVGDTVNASFSFPSGYGIVNPNSDIYVTNNGIEIPSTYSNGILSFTMPDPTQ